MRTRSLVMAALLCLVATVAGQQSAQSVRNRDSSQQVPSSARSSSGLGQTQADFGKALASSQPLGQIL
jgi:hypothetical protein